MMVKKKEMTDAVSDLRKEMSQAAEQRASQDATSDKSRSPKATRASSDETAGDHLLQLKDVEHLLEEHGVDLEELKALWDQFLNELRDLPARKPLVSMFGAFLLGFLAGRMSLK
jgi:hypothetical protein